MCDSYVLPAEQEMITDSSSDSALKKIFRLSKQSLKNKVTGWKAAKHSNFFNETVV